jgi:hypothetical protein
MASRLMHRNLLAGEKPQGPGQGHGPDRVSLERGDDRGPEERISSRKRRQPLTPSQENGNSLALAALMGLFVLLQAYVFPFTRLVVR